MDALHGVAFVHRLRNRKDTFVRRGFQRGIEVLDMQFLVLRKAVHTLPDHTETFLDRVFESAADSHHFAYGFHGTAEFTIDTTELTQVPTRDLTNDVVQRGFEESRCGLRDGVGQFEQSVSKSEFCSYKSEWIPSSLGCQR